MSQDLVAKNSSFHALAPGPRADHVVSEHRQLAPAQRHERTRARITQAGWEALSRGCPRLRSLSMAMRRGCSSAVHFDDASLSLMLQHRTMEYLELPPALSFGAPQTLVPSAAQSCVEESSLSIALVSTLQELRSMWRQLLSNQVTLSSRSLMIIADRCPRLRHLVVHELGTLDQEHLEALARQCPELHLIEFRCEVSKIRWADLQVMRAANPALLITIEAAKASQ
uniref:Uncharacterized protein n=1 Tax=Rhizochromulina marina TaxID=1034831 RepID=A0A7S2WUE5_9STRA|mmetsp:Transcript_6261/g.18287  ORF Transcript_6261/g.18287 Transcript_6261/m.18287 type:complete len:226 (+) Transcript_6261:1-678(+)